MKCRGLVAFVGMFVSLVYGQLETTNWFFGHGAGVSFYNGAAQRIAGGQLGAPGGCTALSDTNGQLRCYSNGYQVWNRNHQLLVNGTALGGDPSAAQPALLVPKPNSSHEVYLFMNQRAGGSFSVAIIDLAAHNGQGEVVSKQVLANGMTEKLTAVLHADQKSYWILAHRWHSDKFIRIRLTQSGLTSIDSLTVGTPHTGTPRNASGVAKFSPAGSYIAVTRPYDDAIDIFDFNTSSGTIVFRRTITTVRNPYGLVFSPDNALMYATGFYYAQGGTRVNQVYQISLPNGTPTVVGSYSDPTLYPEFPAGDMQIGLDGKIYIAIDGQFSLDIIREPTVVGSGCQYQHQAYPLGSNMSRLGLPNFVQSWLVSKIANFTFKNPACVGVPVTFQFNNRKNIPQSIRWYFPDNQVRLGDSVNYIFMDTGRFSVKLVVAMANGIQDSIIKNIEILPSPKNPFQAQYTICWGEPQLLDAENPGATYYWSNGYTNRQIVATLPGKYEVIVRYGGGICQDIFFTEVQQVLPPAPTLGNDTMLCDVKELNLQAGTTAQRYYWSNGSTDSAITVQQSGIYWTEACTGSCCRRDTVHVQFYNRPQTNLPDTVSLCAEKGESQLIQASPAQYYLWQPGNITNSWIIVNNYDYYTLVAWNDSSCVTIDTVFIRSNCQYIWIPTAFSPNGDGKNDFFQITGQNITQFKFQLYTRDGNIIFSSVSADFIWDGENYSEGVYYYTVRYQLGSSPEEYFDSGYVALIR